MRSVALLKLLAKEMTSMLPAILVESDTPVTAGFCQQSLQQDPQQLSAYLAPLLCLRP